MVPQKLTLNEEMPVRLPLFKVWSPAQQGWSYLKANSQAAPDQLQQHPCDLGHLSVCQFPEDLR